MLIDSKIVEYIRPASETNTDAEAWEYFLIWLSPDGGAYCWMFEDFETKLTIEGSVINTKSENITKLFEKANQNVLLIAEDLTENEFDVISDIARALVIRRYFKDGTYTNLAINTNSIRKRKSDMRYNLELEVEQIEKPLMR